MSSIVSSNHDGVDRQDDRDLEWWLDRFLNQLCIFDLPDGSSLPLRARYLNSDAEVGESRFKWLDGAATTATNDFPFPLSNLILVQFFTNRAWYCFHHGLWHYKSIAGKQILVIDNPWHDRH